MWFKVDDTLHSHRKALKAGVPAMGLWALAGSWCGQQLTDGFFPAYAAPRLDPEWEPHAKALVDAGLWIPATKDGEKGWMFHEWDQRQPSKAEVLAERRATADRVARWRERRAREKAEAQPGGSRRGDDNGVGNAVTPPVTNAVANGIRTPAPNPYPNPKGEGAGEGLFLTPGETSVGLKHSRSNDLANHVIESLFDRFWKAYPRRTAKAQARKAFEKAVRRASPEGIIAGAQRYADDPNRDPTYTAHASTWLNGDRWTDEPLPPRTSSSRGKPTTDDKVEGWLALRGGDHPDEPRRGIDGPGQGGGVRRPQPIEGHGPGLGRSAG